MAGHFPSPLVLPCRRAYHEGLDGEPVALVYGNPDGRLWHHHLGCQKAAEFAPQEVPVVTKVKPGPELLRKCDNSLQPDPAKGVAYSCKIMLDNAAKGKDCAARMSALVDWFGP